MISVAIVAIAVGLVPQALATAMQREPRVVECANDAKSSVREWLAHAFRYQHVTLHGGEAMTLAVGTEGCMSVGQSATVFIYERTPHGYRKVLDGVGLPDSVKVSNDGTAVLSAHQTMQTIFESTYVWNGTAYVFSAQRSHLYDVALAERRPYEIPLHVAPGRSATTFSGQVALNFGQTYTFKARRGERLTLEVRKYTGRHPNVVVYFGDTEIGSFTARTWATTLAHTGTYTFSVLPYNETDATRLSTYSIRLTID